MNIAEVQTNLVETSEKSNQASTFESQLLNQYTQTTISLKNDSYTQCQNINHTASTQTKSTAMQQKPSDNNVTTLTQTISAFTQNIHPKSVEAASTPINYIENTFSKYVENTSTQCNSSIIQTKSMVSVATETDSNLMHHSSSKPVESISTQTDAEIALSGYDNGNQTISTQTNSYVQQHQASQTSGFRDSENQFKLANTKPEVEIYENNIKIDHNPNDQIIQLTQNLAISQSKVFLLEDEVQNLKKTSEHLRLNSKGNVVILIQ